MSARKPSTEPRFWYLTVVGKGFRQVTTAKLDLEFVDKFLSAHRRKANLPRHRITTKGRWPDWMAFDVPLVSTLTLECLGDMFASCAEVVPWFQEEGHCYSLLKVTARVPRDRWMCRQISKYGKVIAAADVISIHGDEVPHMFYLEGYLGKIFVSDALAARSLTANLGGALFVDPRIPEMRLAFIPRPVSSAGTGFIRLEDDPTTTSASERREH